jgi:hypothetical protein
MVDWNLIENITRKGAMFEEKCKVRVDVDQKEVQCGDEISGRFFVFVKESVECRGIYLKVLMTTSGKGLPDRVELYIDKIFDGYVFEGEERVFEFKTTVPEGEHTVYGNLISRIWLVTVDVDLAWAWDPYAETDFIVLPSEGKKEQRNQLEIVNDYDVRGQLEGVVILFVVLFILLGILLILVHRMLDYVSMGLSSEGVMGSFAMFGVVYAYFTLPDLKRIQDFRPLQISLSDEISVLGEKGEIQMILNPKKNWNCKSLTFTLFCEEWVRYKIGTKFKTMTEMMFEEVLYVENQIDLEENKDNLFACAYELPKTFSPSMNYPHNKVNWGIEVTCTDGNDNEITTRAFFWVTQGTLTLEQ